MRLLDHERALLLVLMPNDPVSDAFLALLDHPDVVAWSWPAPWTSDRAGVDLLAAMPDLRTITREHLERILDVLVRLHTPEVLDRLAREVWSVTDERVRGFFLKRPVLGTFASIFHLAPKSAELPPPPDFVEGQVFAHGFTMEYRLRRGDEPPNPVAPPEEGSLVFYPFDVANSAARREAHLPEGRGPVLEAFAYGAARDRHRQVFDDIAHGRGWQVVDAAE